MEMRSKAGVLLVRSENAGSKASKRRVCWVERRLLRSIKRESPTPRFYYRVLNWMHSIQMCIGTIYWEVGPPKNHFFRLLNLF